MNPLWRFGLPLVGLGAGLFLLAAAWGIYPSRRLLWWSVAAAACLNVAALAFGTAVHLAAGGSAAELPLVWTNALQLVNLVLIVVGVVPLVDVVRWPQPGRLRLERSHHKVASLGKNHAVAVLVENHGDSKAAGVVYDDLDQSFEPSARELDVVVEPHSRIRLEYHLVPSRRGAFKLRRFELAASSAWGFWRRIYAHPCVTDLHVYPDLQQVQEYAMLARTDRLSLMGLRKARRAGGENEFERLRDYTLDDNFRHLDWRATARRSKLTVRDFQTEQRQRVVFLLDCGRMMTPAAEGISLLDHAMNSILLLSYVALSHGDQVGLMTFSDEVHGFVPPEGGKRQLNRLLHECFDRFPRMVESRCDLAMMHLAVHSPKRALVVLITNLIDEVNAQQLTSYLTHLVGRHLPLAIVLKDRQLFRYADSGPGAAQRDETMPAGPELYAAAAACGIASWRRQVLADLTAKGVLILDAFPEEMTTQLVNRYLEIKARRLL